MTLSEVHQIAWELTRDGSAYEPLVAAVDRETCLRLAGVDAAAAAVQPVHAIGSGEAVCWLFVVPTRTLYRVGATAMGSQVRQAIIK